MTNYVDVHTHLEMPEFDADRESVIQRAKQSGICFICTVGTEPDHWQKAITIAEKNDFIYVSLGVHPHEARYYSPDIENRLTTLLSHPKCVMLGETGLDFFKNHSPRDKQKKAFEAQLLLAEKLNKPVMIHVRDAHTEAQKILKDYKNTGIIHCFSGTVEDARTYIKMGYYLSLPGTVTFKKATNVHDVVRNIPLDHLLTETDAPFIAPEPFRGKRNEPSLVQYTLNRIAELKGITPEDATRTIAVNARKAFRFPVKEEAQLAYTIRNSLYINLTNRCTNQCVFCGKQKDFFVKGHFLRLEDDPSYEAIVKALPEKLTSFDEVVFCGYGEPTLRLDIIMRLGKFFKQNAVKKIRLNTDGLANARTGRNIVPELAAVIDSVSISLNAADEATYNKLCKPSIPNAFAGLISFIKEARTHIREVTATAVALPGLDIQKIRAFVNEDLKVKFRERSYDELG